MKFETVCASLVLCCLCVKTAFAADAPAVPSQDATIQEVVNVANKVIKTACEPQSRRPEYRGDHDPVYPRGRCGAWCREMCRTLVG
jgi:hypothetical protein